MEHSDVCRNLIRGLNIFARHCTFAIAGMDLFCACAESFHLIPAVGPVRRVDEQREDLGLGQQGRSSPWGLL